MSSDVAAPADPPRPVRRDGFGSPVHPFQVASWVVYFGVVGSFYSLFLIPLDDNGRTIAGIVYGVFATLTMMGAVVATRTDPSDPLLAKPASASEEASLSWCYRCEKHVHPSSKHCTMCNKCVDVFDHHCIWLNNCVGRQNIVAFYTVLVGAACMLGTQIVVGCFDIVGFSDGSWGSRQSTMYPSVSALGTFIPMLAVWVLCIAVVALVAQLFSFHALLVLRNITTFDYIVQRGQARNGQEVTPGHGSSLGTWLVGYQRPGGAKGGLEGGGGVGLHPPRGLHHCNPPPMPPPWLLVCPLCPLWRAASP